MKANRKPYSREMLCESTNNFREAGELCDIIVDVDGRKFPAHKHILAAFSPFFKAMFCGNFVEKSQECVKLTGISASAFEILLDVAYTFKIKLTNDNVEDVFCAAHYLQVPTVVLRCIKVLENNLQSKNCLRICSIAEIYGFLDLREKAFQHILRHFTEVTTLPQFLELEKRKLIAIIKEDSLNVPNEDFVLNAVMRWVFFKKDEREVMLLEVLQHVHLSLIDFRFLDETIRQKETFMNLPLKRLFVRILMETYQCKEPSGNRQERLNGTPSKLRLAFEIQALRLCFLTGGKKKNIFLTECGRVFKGWEDDASWQEWPSRYHAIALRTHVDGGGRTQILDKGDWIDVPSFSETDIDDPNRSHTHTGLAVAELNGTWYMIGTRRSTGTSGLNMAIQYSPTEKKWSTTTEMPVARLNPVSATTFNGKLYVIGVEKSSNSLKILCYDPNCPTLKWKHLTSHPLTKIRATGIPDLDQIFAGAIDGRIYVSFRYMDPDLNVNSTVWVVSYDLWRKRWERSQSKTMTCTAPLFLNEKIFVVFRHEGGVAIQFYSPCSNTWRIFAHLPADSLVSVFTGPYLLTGSRENCEDSTISFTRRRVPEKAFRFRHCDWTGFLLLLCPLIAGVSFLYFRPSVIAKTFLPKPVLDCPPMMPEDGEYILLKGCRIMF